MKRVLFVAMIALAGTGCATIAAGRARSTEQMLAAAGFHIDVASTPEKAARLAALPPRKLTLQQYGDKPYYAYADAEVCHCMYVGTESQYQAYERLVVEKKLADERLQAATSWGPWGPWAWGGRGPWPWW
jgi:hypothetical protein